MFWAIALIVSFLFLFGDFSYYFHQRRSEKKIVFTRVLSLIFSSCLPMFSLVNLLELFPESKVTFTVLATLTSGLSIFLVVLSERYRYKQDR